MTQGILPLLLLAATLASCADEEPVSATCPSVLPKWSKPQDGRSAFRIMNVVAFAQSGPTWNGQPVAREELSEYLERGNLIEPAAFVVLDPSAASDCKAATELRDFINQEADCQGVGFCGQGPRQAWENAPGLRGPDWVE